MILASESSPDLAWARYDILIQHITGLFECLLFKTEKAGIIPTAPVDQTGISW